MKNNIAKKETISVLKKILIPGAAKVVQAWRSVGYNNYDAIKDILDNSIDASATEVRVTIVTKNHPTELNTTGKPKKRIEAIIIADNGHGMNMDELTEALRYGSKTTHDCAIDLGKFGMGLNSAGTSMGRRVSVITRKKGGSLITGTLDLDVIVANDSFDYEFKYVNDPKLVSYFDQQVTSPSGTVVVIDKLDLLQNKDPNSFKAALRGEKHLGRTFRHLLADPERLKMYVNEKLVKPYDPLCWNSKGTIRFTDSWVSVKGFETLEYRIACIRDTEDYKGSTVANQGLSWLRNEREISYNRTEPFWNKFPDYRGFLVEIRFGGHELDELVGVNVQKKLAETLDQGLIDKLKEEIMPYHKKNYNELQSAAKKKKKNNNQEALEEELKKYCKKVKNISKSLSLPPIPVLTESNDGHGRDKQPRKKRGNNVVDLLKNVRSSHLGREFEFEMKSWTAQGPMFVPRLGDKNIIIEMNEDHPSVSQGFFEPDVSGQGLLFTNLIMAMALSELQLPEDTATKDAHEKYRDLFSRNCRALTEKITN